MVFLSAIRGCMSGAYGSTALYLSDQLPPYLAGRNITAADRTAGTVCVITALAIAGESINKL